MAGNFIPVLMTLSMSLQLFPVNSQIRTDVATDRHIHNLETELSKLRMLHDEGKAKLRMLEREVEHYQTIFQGLRLVCNTLEKHRQLQKRGFDKVTKPNKSITPRVAGIQASSVVTVITPLGKTVVVQITVHYSTTETHEVIWAYNILGHMIPVKDNDPFAYMIRGKNDESLRTTLYMDIKHLMDVEYLYVKILSEFSEVTILFNKTAILLGGSTVLSPVTFEDVEPLPEVLVIDPNQNATITTSVYTNLSQLASFVNFIGIDASVDPNRLMDLQDADNRLGNVLEKTTRGFSWTVSVDKSLVERGGMLSVRLVEQMTSGPVLQVHVGKTIYLIPGGLSTQMAPFPNNSLGLLSLYRNTGQVIVAKPPVSTIWCYAFGNPVPQTSIFKFKADGSKEKLKGHVFSIGRYDSAEVIILKNITSKDEGQYMCEATNGLNIASEPLYVRVLP